MTRLLVFWLVIGVLYVIAARKAVFDNNGWFTVVWAAAIVALWPFVYLLRLAGQVQRGDL